MQGDASNRLFIVQQNGLVRVYSNNALRSTPFLDMGSLIAYANGGEQGLLSIAFHPNYATNGYFFVYYNNPAGSVEVAQYHVSAIDPNIADPTSRRILLTIPKPFTNHNGGKLNFGPDSNLYFGTGDGGSGGDPFNNAQNLNSLLGKMIRINVDNFTTAPYYTIPATNPLVNMPNTLPEIYSWGLRNPWRWNFDRSNGDMWIADVGQGDHEEVNYVPAGATSGLNYGWRCYEANSNYDLSQCGATPATDKTYPIFEYDHNAAGGYSISGGLIYRGAEYPSLQGYYIFADYVNPNGWILKSNGAGGWIVSTQANYPANTVTFGDAEDGTLYSASLGGTVYKVTATPIALPIKLLSFEAMSQYGKDILKWKTNADQTLSRFEVERSEDARSFTMLGEVRPAVGSVNEYSFNTPAISATRFYRLKIIYNNGITEYTHTLGLSGNSNKSLSAAMIGAGQLQITTPVSLVGVQLIDLQGRRLQHFDQMSPGVHLLSLGSITPGIYFVQCIRQDQSAENIRVSLQ